ncbi:hypothetical protein I6M90_13900 [Acinetobacter bereziniae]|uniref:hypothetical protein n=1 Tax=Acinetobacter bereziniae TaxID=106648 RepID=UPI00190138BC|nr:hypothetical protein [Acinetobacter bereziniae]MBJ8452933.1 hypothetical protein [Acinetobacter bereziniae]MBJ8457152.1 hypothetical protein [Acinetobacter bereziniae]
MKPHKTPLTPFLESNSVKALLKHMKKSGNPIYVKSKPNQNTIQNECFPMVDEYISLNGGERVLGWTLWELPGLFIEAEFHAVWKSPEGELIDLNPRPLKTENILFLQDDSIEYNNYQINNFRLPLTNNPIVINFLNLHDKMFEFMNRGERKGQYGEIKLNTSEQAEYNLIMSHMMMVSNDMVSTYKPLGLYDPCICGSGKKAKWCHKLK